VVGKPVRRETNILDSQALSTQSRLYGYTLSIIYNTTGC
jgi:hypothetical protein